MGKDPGANAWESDEGVGPSEACEDRVGVAAEVDIVVLLDRVFFD